MSDNDRTDYGGIIEFRRRCSLLIRSISIFLVITIFYQQTGLSQTVKPLWAQSRPSQDALQLNPISKSTLSIPRQLASTVECNAVDGAETIINIQDAHASLPAQYSIVDLLDSLAANCDLRFVALEGASGRIDTSILRSLPDKSIRKDTADYLMREGLMSAGEFFTATRDSNDISLFGVEEEALYEQNVDSFRAVASDRAAVIAEIDKLLGQLTLFSGKVYSDDLVNFNRNSLAHRDAALSFSEHWKCLEVFTNKYNIDTSAYAELKKLLESIKIEKIIDFSKANAERQRLIDEISKACTDRARLEELVSKSVAYKQNKLSPADFHGYLIGLAEKMGVSPGGYANLIMFTRYVTIYESMEILGLYRDIEGLEEIIREKLFHNDDERALYRLTTAALLLKRLYGMELTNREFTYFNKNYGLLKAEEFSQFVSKKRDQYDVLTRGDYDLDKIMGGIGEAVKFYSDAEARNNAIFTNTINRMRREGKRVGALITGGYHAEGLTELMKEKRLSYLVVMPKFKNGETRPYVAILTDKKGAYEKLLESGRYQLAASVFFDVKGDVNKLRPLVLRALSEALVRDGDAGFNSVRSSWVDAYRRLFNSAPQARLKDDLQKEIAPDEFQEYLNRFKIAASKDGKAAVIEDTNIDETAADPSASPQDGRSILSVSRGEPSTLFLERGRNGNGEKFYLIRKDDKEDGFYNMLLGLDYAQMFLENSANLAGLSVETRKIVTDVRDSLNNNNKGPRRLANFWVRFSDRLKDEMGLSKPLYVFLQTEDGLTVRLEYNLDIEDREEIDYWDTRALIAEEPADFTAMLLLGGMLRHGLDMESFRQSSSHSGFEGRSIIREPDLSPTLRCASCQLCATHCTNMTAIFDKGGEKVSFKSMPDACNKCQLCTSCPLHMIGEKAAAVENDKHDNIYTGGVAHYLSGNEARGFFNTLMTQLDGKKEALWRNLRLKEAYKGKSIELDSDGNPLYDVMQIEINSSETGVKPWLVTVLIDPKITAGEDAGAGYTVIQRPKAEALIPITTESGEVEIAMAARAQLMGALARGVYDPAARFGGDHRAVKLFRESGMLTQDSLLNLAMASPSMILTPRLDEIAPEVQEYFLDKAGTLMHIMAPLPMQSNHPSQDPLISSMQRELFAIFSDEKIGKELRVSEQKKAKGLLDRLMKGDQSVEGEIMGRYGRWVVSPGSTMCPGCKQHQVYSAPILMAILTSLSYGEIPIIVDSKTTSCWSENNARQLPADLRGGTSAKFPTNRTLYGAHPSSIEAISMTYDEAVEAGYLVPQTLYATGGSGDGGAYIGWDAAGNMSRAFGSLVPRRHSHVQVAVIMVDNQVYANTGGEASGSSVAGGATRTTPLGKTQSGILTLGVAYLPLSLEDMVSQMPGWFVGVGTSNDMGIIYRHYAKAYLMRRPAFYKAVVPCVDILHLPAGMDLNEINTYWEQAGLAPTFEYVGRLMKRIKPKAYNEDERLIDGVPESIYKVIKFDPRFRAYLDEKGGIKKDPLIRAELERLVRMRKWLNWWLDFGTPIAEQAEKYTDDFFRRLEDGHRASPNFKYGHLFDHVTGRLKAEFGEGLRRDFLESIVGVDFIKSFTVKREGLQGGAKGPLKEYFELNSKIQAYTESLESSKASSDIGSKEYAETERLLNEALDKLPNLYDKAMTALKEMADDKGLTALMDQDPGSGSIFEGKAFMELENREAKAAAEKAAAPEDARGQYFTEVLDGILNALGQAKISTLTRDARLKDAKADFIEKGGLINDKKSFIKEAKEGKKYRRYLARIGNVVVRGLSVSGFGGITINRIRQLLERQRGAFTQVVMDFKSARRFDAVDAATYSSSQNISRKDWLKGVGAKAVVVPEHEYTKSSPLRYVKKLDPFGMMIVNDAGSPEDVRDALIARLGRKYQGIVSEIKGEPLKDKKDLDKLRDIVSRKLYGKDYIYLNSLLDRFAGKSEQDFVEELICLAKVHVVTVDADGIMQEVGLDTTRYQHNLVMNSIFYHLDAYYGLPVNREEEIPVLKKFITGIVKKEKVADKYIKAIDLAYKRAKGVPLAGSYPFVAKEEDIAPALYEKGPEGLFPIDSGGQVAAYAASQICTEDFPGYYIGFPITPSSYFLWTFASQGAGGNPYVLKVDENNLSEKIAIQKILLAAKSGLAMVINATSSQGLLLYGEGIPLAVGARLPIVFMITGRAKSAPLLSIKESQEDILTFEKDGPIILMAKNNAEAVYMMYLAKALALILSYPVLVCQSGFTDSHRMEDMPILTDKEVRAWDAYVFKNIDYLRDKIFNKQGEILVTGASADSETYIEGRAVTEEVLESARYLLPYLTHTLDSLTGYQFRTVERYPLVQKTHAKHRVVTMGSRTANFQEAIDILARRGYEDTYSLVRPSVFTPFPDEEIAEAFGWSPDTDDENVSDGLAVVFDMAPGASKPAPLAATINTVSSSHLGGKPRVISLRAGESSRETIAEDLAGYLLFLHLVAGDKPDKAEREFVSALIGGEGKRDPGLDKERGEIDALLRNLLAGKIGTISQEASVPDFVPLKEILGRMKREHRTLLGKKDYAAILTRIYGRGSFFDINEMYDKTKTYFKLLIALEIMSARHFLALKEAGQVLDYKKQLRYALILLEYSQNQGDHLLAAETLNRIVASGDVEIAREAANVFNKNDRYRELAERSGVSVQIPENLNATSFEQALEPARHLSDAERLISEENRKAISEALKEAMKKDPYPQLLERKKEEVGLLEKAISDAALESRFEPLNPVNIERLALERLSKNKSSQLHGHEIYGRGEERLFIEGYRLTYRVDIDTFLTRSIVPADFAPELLTIFRNDGMDNLTRLISTSIRLRTAVRNALPTVDDVESDLVAYLEGVIYPELASDPNIVPKPDSFYYNYYLLAEADHIRAVIQDLLGKARNLTGETQSPLSAAQDVIDLDSPEGEARYHRYLHNIVESSRWSDSNNGEKDALIQRSIVDLFSAKREGGDHTLFEVLTASGTFNQDRARQIIQDWLKTNHGAELVLEIEASLAKAKAHAVRDEVKSVTDWVMAHYDISQAKYGDIEAMVKAQISRSAQSPSGDSGLSIQEKLAHARMQATANGRTYEEELIDKIDFFDTTDLEVGFWARLFILQEGIIAKNEAINGLDARYAEQAKNLIIAKSASDEKFLISEPSDLIIFVELAVRESRSDMEIEGMLKGRVSSELFASALLGSAVRILAGRFRLEEGGTFARADYLKQNFSRLIQARKIVTLADLQTAAMAYYFGNAGNDVNPWWILGPEKSATSGGETDPQIFPKWNTVLDDLIWLGFNVKRPKVDSYMVNMIDPDQLESYERITVFANGFVFLKTDLMGTYITGDIERDLVPGGLDRWSQFDLAVRTTLEDVLKWKERCDEANPPPQQDAGKGVIRYILSKELFKLSAEELRSLNIRELSTLSYDELVKNLDGMGLEMTRAIQDAPIPMPTMYEKGYERYGFASKDGRPSESDRQFYTHRMLLRYLSVLTRAAKGGVVANLDDLDVVVRYEFARYDSSQTETGDLSSVSAHIAADIKNGGIYNATLLRDDREVLRLVEILSESLEMTGELKKDKDALRGEAGYLYRQAMAVNQRARRMLADQDLSRMDKNIEEFSRSGRDTRELKNAREARAAEYELALPKLTIGEGGDADKVLNSLIARMVRTASERQSKIGRMVKGDILRILERSNIFQAGSLKERPVIESRGDLKVMVKYFLNGVLENQSWDEYRKSHKFTEIEDQIAAKLLLFSVDPDFVYPDGLAGLILEIAENLATGPAEGWQEARAKIEDMLRKTGPADCKRCGEPTCALYALHAARGELDPILTPCLTLGENSSDMAGIRDIYADMYSTGGAERGALVMSKAEWEVVFKYMPVEQRVAQIILSRLYGGLGSSQRRFDDGVFVVSSGEFQRNTLGLVGRLVFTRITEEEREFLCRHGERVLEYRKRAFDEESDVILREKRKREPVEAARARAPESVSDAFYAYVTSIDDLSERDRDVILEKRRMDASGLLREDYTDAYLFTQNPDRMESVDELLTMLEAKFWQSLKLPSINDVKRRLSLDSGELLKQHLTAIGEKQKEREEREKALIDDITRGKVVGQKRGSFEQDELRIVIRKHALDLKEKAGLKLDVAGADSARESLANKVFAELTGSGIKIDDGVRFGWNYLYSDVQDYLKTSESGKAQVHDVAEFMGRESLAWGEMTPGLQKAVLMAFIAYEVRDLAREIKIKPVSPRTDEEILEEVITRQVIERVRSRLTVTRGLPVEKDSQTALVKEIDAILSSPGTLSMPNIAELVGGLSVNMRKVIPHYAPIGMLNLMLLSKMDNYSGQRFLDRRLKYLYENEDISRLDINGFMEFIRNPQIASYLARYDGLSGISMISADEIRSFVRGERGDDGGAVLQDIAGVDQKALRSLMGRYISAKRAAFPIIDKFLDDLQREYGLEGFDGTRNDTQRLRNIGVIFQVVAGLTADNSLEIKDAEDKLFRLDTALTPRADRLHGDELDQWRKLRQETLQNIFKSSISLVREAFPSETSAFGNETLRYYLSRRLFHRFKLAEHGEGIPLFIAAYAAKEARVSPEPDDKYRFIAKHEPARLEASRRRYARRAGRFLREAEGLFFEALSGEEPQLKEVFGIVTEERSSALSGEADTSITSSFLQINRMDAARSAVSFSLNDYHTYGREANVLVAGSGGMHRRYQPGMNLVCEFADNDRGNEVRDRIAEILHSYSYALVTASRAGSAVMPPGLEGLTEKQVYKKLRDNLIHILHNVKKWNDSYGLSLENVRITAGSPHAARLTTDDKVVEIAVESLVNVLISADFILDDLLTHATIRDRDQDSRIPADLYALAEEVAVSWHTLDRVKLLMSKGGELDAELIELFKWFGDQNIIGLLQRFVERDDLSESDEIFPWIIDHIKKQDIYKNLRPQVEELDRIKSVEYGRYEKIVSGMIAQARANTGKLPRERKVIQKISTADPQELWRAVVSRMGRIADDKFKLELDLKDYANLPLSQVWDRIEELYIASLHRNLDDRSGDRPVEVGLVQEKAAQFNDSYEMAALLLFSEIDIPGVPYNKRFIQFLIQNRSIYDRFLAASYSIEEAKLKLLDIVLGEFNALPENHGINISYSAEQKAVLLKVIFLRPDVVKDAVRREYKKDIYRSLPIADLEATRGKISLQRMGLFKNTYALHPVLHRLQGMFGSITLDVYKRVADELKITRAFLNDTIIFYPRFSTSPAGDIEVRLCRYGGACILEGVAGIAEVMRDIIGVEEGALSKDMIQVFYDACLGKCFLAPVMMAIDRRTGKVTFFGPLEREKMSSLLEILTSIPSYPQKHELFRAAKEGLAPAKGFFVSNEHKVISSSPRHDNSMIGKIATVDYEGGIHLVPESEIGKLQINDGKHRIGALVPERVVSFEYVDLGGKPAVATLIISDQLKILDAIDYDIDPGLKSRAGSMIAPQVYLDESTQELYIVGGEKPLGRVNANTIAVRQDSGEIITLTLEGENKPISLTAIPPKEEDVLANEPPEFVLKQDRLIFGDEKLTVPWDSEEAVKAGLLDPVLEILRIGRDLKPVDNPWRPWSQEEIFTLVGASLLQGRGGAFFPTMAKWRSLRDALREAIDKGETARVELSDGLIVMAERGRARIVINADEGDPQAYRDREIIEKRPYKLIAGATVIAIALGIQEIDVFTRAEYEKALYSLDRAIHQARARGWLGKNIYGVNGLNIDMEIRPGSGNFLSGEARAISINAAGYAGVPPREKVRLPESKKGYLSTKGGGERIPTMVQNVTTTVLTGELVKLAVPRIRRERARGAAISDAIDRSAREAGRMFVELGYGGTGGPIAITTSGQQIRFQGVIENSGPVVLRRLYEISGGAKAGEEIFAIQFAGPAGELIKLNPDAFTEVGGRLTAEDWAWIFDLELTPINLRFFNWIMGSGAIGFAHRKVDFLDFVNTYIEWLGKESDGQCPGCLNPAHVLVSRLKRIQTNNAVSTDLWAIRDIVAQSRKQNVECGLGMNLPNPILSSLRSLPVDYLYHILRNPSTDLPDLLESLYALDLGDREIARSGKEGSKKIFNIDGHIIRLVTKRLSEIDAFKPAEERVSSRFLRLLGLIPQDMKPEEIDINKLQLNGKRIEVGVSEDKPSSSDALSTDTPSSSRGKSGLPNEIYTWPIHKAISNRDFDAVNFKSNGLYEEEDALRLDDGSYARGKLSLTDAERKTLARALSLLEDEDKGLLNGSTVLFIKGLDNDVSKARVSSALDAGRAPPAESCYGTHYGMSRHQYYIDTDHLKSPEDFVSHLRHEIRERAKVKSGTTPKDAHNEAVREELLLDIAARFRAQILKAKVDEHDIKMIRDVINPLEFDGGNERDWYIAQFRTSILPAIEAEAPPAGIVEIWDMADKLGLTDEELGWIKSKIFGEIERMEVTLELPALENLDGSGNFVGPTSISTHLPRRVVDVSVSKFNLDGRLDKVLKNVVRWKFPEELRISAERVFRGARLSDKSSKFIADLADRQGPMAEKLRDALKLIIGISDRHKNPDFVNILDREKLIAQDILARYDEHEKYAIAKKRGITVTDIEPISVRPAMEACLKAAAKVELIDYIFNRGWDSTVARFSDTLLYTEKEIFGEALSDTIGEFAPRENRIRNIKDYIRMYSEILPMDKREREAVDMSRVVLCKLYMFLRESGGRLIELAETLKDHEDDSAAKLSNSLFKTRILASRLTDIMEAQTKILETYKEIQGLYEKGRYQEVIQSVSKLLLGFEGEASKQHRYTYPVSIMIIDKPFTAAIVDKADKPGIQWILNRLNAIEFEMSRLIEFMESVVKNRSRYSVLRYPCYVDYDFGVEQSGGWWSLMQEDFRRTEGVDISQVRRIVPANPMRMDMVAFGDTIKQMIIELLKNAVAYARHDPIDKNRLVGEIREDFKTSDKEYEYSIEDNNNGISGDRLESVFDVSVSTGVHYKEYAGFGRGLAEVRNIVDMHGGSIRLISRVKGEEPYEIKYSRGQFSKAKPAEGGVLSNETGTKFIITFPRKYVTSKKMRRRMSIIKNIPHSEKGVNEELPLVRHATQDSFGIVLGIPESAVNAMDRSVYDKLLAMDRVSIVSLKAIDREGMISELNEETKGTRSLAALLDIDARNAASFEEMERLIIELKDQVARDVVALTSPDVASLTYEQVQQKIRNIEDRTSNIGLRKSEVDGAVRSELLKIIGIYARLLPQGVSYHLSEKSIYELRMKRIYDIHREDYTDTLKRYLADGVKKEGARQYAVTGVDSVLDLKMLAQAINERRAKMGVVDKEKDPIKDYVIIRSEAVNKLMNDAPGTVREGKLSAVLEAVGLGLGTNRIIVLSDGAKANPEDIVREINSRSGGTVNNNQIVIGQTAGIIDVDPNSPGSIFTGEDALLFIQGESEDHVLASQLYQMMLEVTANGGRALKVEQGALRQVGNHKFFIYLPKTKTIDYKIEAENYDRYVSEVMIKA